MLKEVQVTDRFRLTGIRENHRAYPNEMKLQIFGGDTETIKGRPDTLQIVGPKDELFKRVTKKTIFPSMMNWIIPRAIPHGVNLVWFHNLNFDLRVLFYENLREMYDQYNNIRFEKGGYVVKMLFGRVNQADIWEDLGGYLCPKCLEPVPKDATDYEDGKRVCTRHRASFPAVRRNLGIKIRLMDSAAFCPPGSKSLIAAIKIYDVGYSKLPQPKGLGERRLDTPEFKEYALNDARAERALGRKIMDLHRDYDVTTCVSLPQLSARILRHHFFLPGESIQFPPEACRRAAEYSYHAGKNGFYVERGIYENVYEYDINSAFPKAMRELPQMYRGKYALVKSYDPSRLGVYCVSGEAFGAVVPALFNHDFSSIKEGLFSDVWVTGFDLECLKNNSDYRFRISHGWVWKPESSWSHSPLKSFVDRFWKLKSTEPKGPKRDTYKNILNSLYGKFAASVAKKEIVWLDGKHAIAVDGEGTYYTAGALYQPFVASQITGRVRRDLFRLEIKGKALHAATDSIKSFKKLPTSDVLGGLKLEVFGRCYLFRTKLYLHFGKTTEHCGHDLKNGWIRQRGTDKLGKIFDVGGVRPQHLCKYALHGFKGSVFELFENRRALLNDGYLDYEYRHMVNLREGIRRGEPVSTMLDRKERLQLK